MKLKLVLWLRYAAMVVLVGVLANGAGFGRPARLGLMYLAVFAFWDLYKWPEPKAQP